MHTGRHVCRWCAWQIVYHSRLQFEPEILLTLLKCIVLGVKTRTVVARVCFATALHSVPMYTAAVRIDDELRSNCHAVPALTLLASSPTPYASNQVNTRIRWYPYHPSHMTT